MVTIDQLIHAIYGQESGHGSADTSKANNRGAQGPMQVTQDTFKGMQRQGLVPPDWSLDNPAQAMEAGRRHVRTLWNQYNGDVDSVLAAYYSGPKAVTKEGIRSFRDPVNKGAPDTLGYVAQVKARLPGGSNFPPAKVAGPQAPVRKLAEDSLTEVSTRPPVPLADDPLLERMPGRDSFRTPKTGNIPDLSYKPLGGITPVSQEAEVKAGQAAAQARADVERGQTFYAATQAGFMTGLSGTGLRALSRSLEEFRPDPSFKVPALEGTQAEQEFLSGAVNAQDFARRQMEVESQRKYVRDLSSQGLFGGLAAAFLGTAHENALLGAGVVRSLSLAKVLARSRAAAALQAGAVESVATAGAQLAVDPLYTKDDAMQDALLGAVFTAALVSPSLVREGKLAARIEATAETQANRRVLQEQQIADRSPDATPEERAVMVGKLQEAEKSAAAARTVHTGEVHPMLREEVRPDFVGPQEPDDAFLRRLQDRWARESPDAPQAPEVGRLLEENVAFEQRVLAGQRALNGAEDAAVAGVRVAEAGTVSGPSAGDKALLRAAQGTPDVLQEQPRQRDRLRAAQGQDADLQARIKREQEDLVWAQRDALDAGVAARGTNFGQWLGRQVTFPQGAGEVRAVSPAGYATVRGADGREARVHLSDTAEYTWAKGHGEGFAGEEVPAIRAFSKEGGQDGPVDLGWEGWDDPRVWQRKAELYGPGGKKEHEIGQELRTRRGSSKWSTLADLRALKPGVHFNDSLRNWGLVKSAAETLRKRFLGDDFRLIISDYSGTLKREGADGALFHLAENVAIVNLDMDKPPAKIAKVLVHEIGHAVWQRSVAKLDPARRAAVDHAYRKFTQAKGQEQARMRYANSSSGSTMSGVDTSNKYEVSRNEFSAEQFLKYVEDDVLGHNRLGLDKAVQEILFKAIAQIIAFFKGAADAFRKPEAEYAKLFDDILRKQAARQEAATSAAPRQAAPSRAFSKAPGSQPAAEMGPEDIVADPDAVRLGVDTLPMDTPHRVAEAKAILDLHRQAEAANVQVDEKRLSKLLDTALFEGGQSTANILLRSQNSVARWFAARFTESASGAAGRGGRSAAIAKSLHEQGILGNSVNDLQAHYREYRQAAGESAVGDVLDGRLWREFNEAVAAEIEARKSGTAVPSSEAVRKAADSLEKAYERARKLQQSAKTLGWATLPDTSRGYMPHLLDPDKLRAMTLEQKRFLISALRDQFIDRLGFDITFADHLAAKYVDRGMRRALGEASTPTPSSRVGAADVLEDALEAAGLTRQEIRDTMQRFLSKGPGHTKKRLDLDLNREFTQADGSVFRLRDAFQTDQLALLRQQAGRVSGEVALTEQGIYGRAGLDVVRRALSVGGAVSQRELDAFDQIAAEFLGAPYGSQSKIVDRVTQANALVRLGGMGFTQLAEYINSVVHLGVGATLDAIGSVGRLRSEIKDLAAGKSVNNGLLSGMENLYGAEFGTLSYKTVFPFDHTIGAQTWGQESLTFLDRLLRGGAHVQGKLSLWRTIHSAQQRGVAEQIVRKAAVMLQKGGDDVYLKEMGFTDDLIQKMRTELPLIAKWDKQGRLLELDVTKASDLDAAREFTQAVHRGVSQIIQGTFIGERSKWATDSMMRLLTQFRTFSLTAVEKQWGRSVGMVGPYKSLGILLGTMCVAAPLYAARTYVNSVGREDQDEYLDAQLQPERIARQTMNYVALSGLTGDLLDGLGALSGVDLGGGQGRAGREQGFVGELVAPATGLLDDAYKAFQNTEEGTGVRDALKVAPFSGLPYFGVLVRLLTDD